MGGHIIPFQNMDLKQRNIFMHCKEDRQLLKKIHSYRQIY